MKNINSENEEKANSQEHIILVKNTVFSFFINYGNIVFQIIISMLIARLISKELWGFLILAISYITIITIISNYFPPALDYSLNFYIPRYIALNQKTKLKSFIKNAIYLKLLLLIPIFFISILIFQLFSELFIITLKENLILLYLLLPLIIINGLNPILNGINRGFNMFKTIFILSLISSSFHISALLYCFLFFNNVNIELIALIFLIATLIPFIINCFIIPIKLYKVKNDNEKGESFKEISQKTFKYGFPISFGYLVYGFWKEIQIQGIGLFSTPENVTGYNISLSYSQFSEMLINSFYLPLFTSFSRLNSIQNKNQINLIYNLTLKYTLFLLLLVSGLLYFFGDFFLFLIYGESYLVFSFFLKLMIISTIFKVVGVPFDALLLAQNMGKYLAPIRLIMILIYASIFFTSLGYFGILGAIFGIIISNILISFLYLILTFKIVKVKLNLKKTFFQYLIFFIALGITLIFENLMLKTLNDTILLNLNLLVFKYLPFLSISTFIIIFVFLNIILKIFSRKDIEYLELIFNREKKFDRLIRKSLRFLKKLIIFFKR